MIFSYWTVPFNVSFNDDDARNGDESNGESSAVDLSLNEFVELVPADGLSSESADWVNYLDQLVIGVAVFQLIVDVSQVVEVQLSLALHVQKSEVGLASLLREGAALNNNKKYDAGGEFLEESFKVEGVSTGGVIDFLEKSEDKLVFGLKAEGAGSEEEFSDISPSLSGVGIEGEEGV